MKTIASTNLFYILKITKMKKQILLQESETKGICNNRRLAFLLSCSMASSLFPHLPCGQNVLSAGDLCLAAQSLISLWEPLVVRTDVDNFDREDKSKGCGLEFGKACLMLAFGEYVTD